MAWPFLQSKSKRIDEIVAVDLGGRQTKAVWLQSKNGSPMLRAFAVKEAPPREKDKPLSPEVLGEHLKTVFKALGEGPRQAVLALGVADAVVRQAELPPMPVGDMRQLLRINGKSYLQQELPNHVFDCAVLLSKAPPAKPEAGKSPPASAAGPQKQRVLVGGALRQSLDDLVSACKAAGVVAREICPGLIGPINAFEAADRESFAKQVVALVEIGFRHSSISILQHGELVINRVVALGGDHLTQGLAEALGISYAEAEGIKVGMPGEVQQHLEPLLASLGRELRASIDFFEHERDVPVNRVLMSGGSARSDCLVRCLQTELMLPCASWNPAQNLHLQLPVEQRGELEQVAPQLSVAVGAGVALF